jgi:hypothetical protein
VTTFPINNIPVTKLVFLNIVEAGSMKQPIVNEHRFEQLDDGSLKIENVEAMDASNYSCAVNNGVGVSLSKTIHVHVNSKS